MPFWHYALGSAMCYKDEMRKPLSKGLCEHNSPSSAFRCNSFSLTAKLFVTSAGLRFHAANLFLWPVTSLDQGIILYPEPIKTKNFTCDWTSNTYSLGRSIPAAEISIALCFCSPKYCVSFLRMTDELYQWYITWHICSKAFTLLLPTLMAIVLPGTHTRCT